MTVSAAAWAEARAFRPNPGQFPIRVERHLNSFVAAHLPGVTTVTSATRYYALHGLIARIAAEQGLDDEGTVQLLRRSEVLLACVTRHHASNPVHDGSTPLPHGIDAIVRVARTSGGYDLVSAARAYAQRRWAFANPYRGSELTLKVLAPGGFTPGEWYDDTAARSVLAPLVAVARGTDEISDTELGGLSDACLCTTATSPDGAWLAGLLSGEPGQGGERPTLGGLLWQFGRMTAVATGVGEVTDADSLADLVMFDSGLRDHPRLTGLVAVERWRGALLRKESVYAWRLIWRAINDLVDGARPVNDLVEAFADLLPATTVAAFRTSLPSPLDDQRRPRRAERDVAALPDLERWLARLILGADRLDDLRDEELRGYRGREEHVHGQWEELSPGWVAEKAAGYASRSLRDLGRDLAISLVHRSQRVALWKARFDHSSQSLSFPAGLHVRDGIAVKVFDETAPVPATRIPQYLSIARQAGLFVADDDGRLSVGPNGRHLG
jgi:hypothetical protein